MLVNVPSMSIPILTISLNRSVRVVEVLGTLPIRALALGLEMPSLPIFQTLVPSMLKQDSDDFLKKELESRRLVTNSESYMNHFSQ